MHLNLHVIVIPLSNLDPVLLSGLSKRYREVPLYIYDDFAVIVLRISRHMLNSWTNSLMKLGVR